MVITETAAFTKRIVSVMEDEDYRMMQVYLLGRPDAGVVIPGTSGLRKLRWALSGRGKRGGVRVIYYWYVADAEIYMLAVFAKNQQDDLSDREKKLLKRAVELGLEK